MPPESPHNEKELLRLVARGDADSFRLLFNAYNDRVYKTAYQYLKSYDLAKEVVQEVIIKLWDKKETLAEVDHFKTWLQTLSKNHIIDFMRRLEAQDSARRKWADGVGHMENTTDYKVRNAQYDRLLEEALGKLSDQQRAVYKLSKEKGLSREQIAAELAMSPNTVKTHMQRALSSIRDFLKDHGEVYLLLLLMSRHG